MGHPIQAFCRTATPNGRARLARRSSAGDYLVLLYASGNRDESVFGPDADRFDIERPATPAHVAFGFGEHLCLGASLGPARSEAGVRGAASSPPDLRAGRRADVHVAQHPDPQPRRRCRWRSSGSDHGDSGRSSPPTRRSTTRSPTRSRRSRSRTGRGPRRSARWRRRKDGSVAAGVRHGQVPEPRRARRVRRREPRHASSGPCARAAGSRPTSSAWRPGRSATRCSSRCASCASRSRPTTWCRSASSGRSPARCRAALEQPEHHRSPRRAAARRRHRPLPPDRARPRAGSRSTASATSSTTRPRCRPATTRGACATWSGAPVDDVEDAAAADRACRRTVIWSPILLRAAGRHPLRAAPLLPAPRHRRAGSASSCRAASSTPTDGASRSPRSSSLPTSATTTAACSAAELDCTMADGSARPLTVTALGDTGFHLGAGLYFGFDGHWHGEWRGDLHVDGEHIADCTDPTTARRAPPDPRQPRPRRRPGRRRRRRRQPAEHLRGPAPRPRPHRGSDASVTGRRWR